MSKGNNIMQKITAYEIINHGYDNSQYFQGCGTYGTEYNEVFTGIGNNAKEAYEDAVEQIYSMPYDTESIEKIIPIRPKGIRIKDKVPATYTKDDESDCYWYVSIRVKVESV